MMLRTSKPPQLAVWEYAPQILGAFNDEQGSEAFSKLASVDMAEGRNLGLGGPRFEVDIIEIAFGQKGYLDDHVAIVEVEAVVEVVRVSRRQQDPRQCDRTQERFVAAPPCAACSSIAQSR